MVSYLNPYRNFIDVSTKDGLTLLSNATDKFESPLVGDQRVSLSPGKNDFQLLKDNLMRLSKKFGYEYLLNNVATTRTVVPATGRTAATTTFSNPIKIMEVYDDKILELAQKHASITWGNESFTNQFPKTISDLTEANGHLDATGALTQDGKDIIQGRIHSKILAYQILAMLSDSARQVIERQAEEYTWKDSFGLDEEMDGMTILALVIRRLRPHHKVDMYAEIGLVKKLTLAQYDNDVHLFCDAINSKKLMIDMKDPMAYTDDALVRDLFHVFKHDSLPLDFRSEFTALERRWQMDKERVTSQSLMEDAGSYYTNMVASGDWKLEVGKNAQIIALTTQISELKTAFNQIKIDKPTKPNGDDTSKQLAIRMILFRCGVSQKSTMTKNSTWSKRKGKHTTGVINTSIMRVNSGECMFFISQRSMVRGKRRKMNSMLGRKEKANLRNRILLLLLLLHLLLLQMLLRPNYLWPNLFRKH